MLLIASLLPSTTISHLLGVLHIAGAAATRTVVPLRIRVLLILLLVPTTRTLLLLLLVLLSLLQVVIVIVQPSLLLLSAAASCRTPDWNDTGRAGTATDRGEEGKLLV